MLIILLLYLFFCGLPVTAAVLWQKARKDKPAKEVLDAWQNDSANWKMVFFYHNKADKRIFVPKRFHMGWTANYANPYSVLLSLWCVVFPILMVLFVVLINK